MNAVSDSEDLPTKRSLLEPHVNVEDEEEAAGRQLDEVIDLTQPASSFSFAQRALKHGDTMCRRLRAERLSTTQRSTLHSSSESLTRSEKRNNKKNSSFDRTKLPNGDSSASRRLVPSSAVVTPKPRHSDKSHSKQAIPEFSFKTPSFDKRVSVQTISSDDSSSCEILGRVDCVETVDNGTDVDGEDDVVMTKIEKYSLPSRLVSPDFKKLMQRCKYTETDWLKSNQNRVRWVCEQNRKKAEELQKVVKEYEKSRKAHDEWLSQQTLRLLHLSRKMPTPVEEPYIELDVSEEEEEVQVGTVLPPITDHMRQRVANAMRSQPQTVLSDAFRLQVTTAELSTLRPREWLSDMVINFYMQLIAERNTNCEGLPSAYPMTTFFYPKLVQAGYAGVRRWTRRVDIFAHDLVLVPIHLGHHWCFALIQMKDQKISYFDSMQNPNNECLSQLLQYLVDEAKEKKGTVLNVSEWSIENSKKIPVQRNGYDCGVFTCQFAEYLSRGAALTFTQENMPYFRERMIFEILEKKMLL